MIDWLNKREKPLPYHWFGSYIFDSDDLRITEHSLWSSVHSPRLDMDFLDPEIVGLIKNRFESGPQSAIRDATMVLEERIRSRIGDDAVANGNFLVGSVLVAKAFSPDHGILSDMSRPHSERQGLFQLFDGAMRYVRNPNSHRFMDTSDIQLQCEFIYFIDLLLRVIPDAEGIGLSRSSA